MAPKEIELSRLGRIKVHAQWNQAEIFFFLRVLLIDVFIVIINKQFHKSFDITYFHGKIKEVVKNLIVFFYLFL